jgi:hypothetical protein
MTGARTFRRARDEGVALIVVIGIGAVLTLLVTAALSISLSGVVKAQTDQNWNGAVAAAYAGVDDYKSKLANDGTYAQYGNPDAVFSAQSKAAGTLVLPTGAKANPALGIGLNGTWAMIAGGGGAPAYYRYEVDNSSYSSTGVLRLRSTGRVGNQARSVVVNLKQSGFIDFLYFSNYEVADPVFTGLDGTDGTVNCAKYDWQSRSSSCDQIQFASGDVINGPLHSNDTLYICGATFNGPVTTATTKTPPRYDKPSSGCSTPTFKFTGNPAFAPVIAMPPSNAQMKDETRTDLTAQVPRPGCLYTGPTSIVFNADGTMTVRSPWTKATRVVGNPATAAGTPPPGASTCGQPGNPTAANLAANANTLAGEFGQKIAVPANNLVYVQSVPTSRPGDPNFWAATKKPVGLTCTGLSGSTGSGNGIGFPAKDEFAPTTQGISAYDCYNGDAFVQGTMRGALTISADNYVYVTGDIAYQDPKADILGLVAQNAVWVWNPMKCTSAAKDCVVGKPSNFSELLADNRRIDAAILSVNHTFQVQNYNVGGKRGTLTINGAIAQNFRGPVGTSGSGGTGYLKNYLYDQRYRNIAPPKFLVPPSTTYGVSVQVEVGKAFNADGSAA